MFRHQGKARTYTHNLRLASILSFVAGIVNITGVSLVKTLTTNVTGHFAYFSEELFNQHYGMAGIFLLYILSFLIGAFVSNLLIEIVARLRPKIAYVFPMVSEIIILCFIGLLYNNNNGGFLNGQMLACLLLFAMGLQNSLVTSVSRSVVRTTHLTGLFTDLGIELSQLFFYRQHDGFQRLSKSIYLKLAIIAGFFFGCIAGGFMVRYFGARTLLAAAACLVVALLYDNIRFQYYHLKRKIGLG